MIVIGITGSIGMGKSTVADMLRAMGLPVHDADAAVHTLLAPGGAGVAAVGQKFPAALKTGPDGRPFIDRAALGQAVFADPQKKKDLEALLHPLVRADSDKFLAEMKGRGHPAAVLDVPLLFETGGEKRVDAVLCVSAPREVQQARVLARPGMTLEKFNRIVAGQMPDAEKRRRADYVIETGQELEETRRQLTAALARILPKSAPPQPPAP